MAEITRYGDIIFKTADSIREFDDARMLFLQYAQSLDIDLAFQNFSDELQAIEKQYNKPAGALLLAYKDDKAIGCAGIRRLDPDTAELKRMFVQPAYRQYKIGKKLLELAIDIAKALNYKVMRLDTLPTMMQALTLYRLYGFYEIPPYRFNPVEGALYMEKQLL